MDILELIDDREQSANGQAARPFSCPEEECAKVSVARASDPERQHAPGDTRGVRRTGRLMYWQSFNRKSDLQRHHRIHTKERPYRCNQQGCGKSFIQRSALTVHIRTHTGEKPHHCEQPNCGKSFSDVSTIHARIVNDADPLRCQSSSLARHRRIHTGKRPYKCAVDKCDKRYRRPTDMQGQLLTLCSFCRKTTLTKHARRAHRMSTDNQYSEDDSSESESEEPPATKPHGTPQARWPLAGQSAVPVNGLAGYPVARSQSAVDNKAERVTPFSPREVPSATSRQSISESFTFPTNQVMHLPDHSHAAVTHPLPISQGVVYASQQCDTVMSPVVSIPTPLAQDYDPTPLMHHYHSAGHRLEASATPTPQRVFTAAQPVQSSPSSLSSGSSQQESANSHELYYAQLQSLPIQQYQLQPSPMIHDGTLQYPHYQAVSVEQQSARGHAMPPPTMPPQQQFHTISQPQPQAQAQQQSLPPQAWYDHMAYQPPVMVSVPEPTNQSRLHTPNTVQDWWIKQEESGMLLPSARLSNF
ncbi:hypothetical protein MMC16_006991 [Acarospora aff. strigata]|nr:hypothetical protein [Acarospora aff. strigata]